MSSSTDCSTVDTVEDDEDADDDDDDELLDEDVCRYLLFKWENIGTKTFVNVVEAKCCCCCCCCCWDDGDLFVIKLRCIGGGLALEFRCSLRWSDDYRN